MLQVSAFRFPKIAVDHFYRTGAGIGMCRIKTGQPWLHYNGWPLGIGFGIEFLDFIQCEAIAVADTAVLTWPEQTMPLS